MIIDNIVEIEFIIQVDNSNQSQDLLRKGLCSFSCICVCDYLKRPFTVRGLYFIETDSI
jgi:hypothetical protein